MSAENGLPEALAYLVLPANPEKGRERREKLDEFVRQQGLRPIRFEE